MRSGDPGKTDRLESGRDVSPEESELWRHVTREIRPLAGGDAERPPRSSAAGREEEPVSSESIPHKTSDGPGAFLSAAPPLTHRDSPGLDKRTRMRLIRGQIPVDARIDLHGHTREEARGALLSILEGAAAAGRRCVLVITGKGLRTDAAAGVLKQLVPRWLNEMPLRPHVLAFAYALPRDGGEGALYVLLKRRRT